MSKAAGVRTCRRSILPILPLLLLVVCGCGRPQPSGPVITVTGKWLGSKFKESGGKITQCEFQILDQSARKNVKVDGVQAAWYRNGKAVQASEVMVMRQGRQGWPSRVSAKGQMAGDVLVASEVRVEMPK